MSLGYSAAIKLDANYNKSNIRLLLKKGSELGIVYHEFMNYSSSGLSEEQAIKTILKGGSEVLHCLTISINEAYATLHFLNDEDYLLVMFSGLSHLWSKKYLDGTYGVDLARYVKLLLDVADEFKILELKVEKD